MASISVGAETRDETLRAIVLIMLAVLMFSLLDACAKYLGQFIPAMEVTWLRFLVHVALLCVVMRVWRHVPTVIPKNIPMQTLRALFMCAATGFNFAAIQYLQLAEAVAIMFAAPLLVTALSGPILGEWAGPRRWAAVVVGFLGVLLVTRPGFAEVHWAVFLSLGATISYTFYIFMTRRLGASESAGTLLIWPGFVGAAVYAPVAIPTFVMPELALWPIIALMGVFGALGHYVFIKANQMASPNVLAPFTYSQMPWMVILGLLLFGDVPDVWTLAGSLIIGASGLYILHRERIRAREARRVAAAP